MNKRFLTLLLALVAIVTGSKAQTDSETPLTLEALETTIVTISNPREITTFYYQRNDKANVTVNYTALKGSNVTSIRLSKGDKLKLWGNCTQYGASYASQSTKIDCDGDCYIYGNIMSMFNLNSFPYEKLMNYDYTFAHLFKGNTHIKNHSSKALVLPATTLTKACYRGMFEGCTGLTTAPNLPALALTNSCYEEMFLGCTSLTTAPTIQATTLGDSSCDQMFKGCTSLNTAPKLYATTMAPMCYKGMFADCTSLSKAPELPATTLAMWCYNGMFYGCKSLTAAPELPALIMAEGCYWMMFYGCTSLVIAPALPATTLAKTCYYGMFYECTGLTQAPDLLATKLESQSYNCMFYGCTKLDKVRCMATQLGSSYAAMWLKGVASSGSFTKNPYASVEDLTNGEDGIPNGWKVSGFTDVPWNVRYDTNNDGVVNTADVVNLVNYIMSH